MQDKELYRQILGISAPWYVDRVELELKKGEVRVFVDHEGDVEWPCAECGRPCRLYDHQEERIWRHLDTCQFRTVLHAKVPRSDCPEHGAKVVKLPWAGPSSRFTALFEALAISWLLQASQKAVAQQLNLSWEEIHLIMERAVKRGLERRKAENIPHLGVDEKAFQKGHRYLTLVNDLDRGRVLYIAEEREEASLNGFWSTLTRRQLHSIEAVAIDMWDAYLHSIQKHLPEADSKIVFDKFHIAQHLTEAVDQVRRKEHKRLKADGDQRLKGTRFKWLRNPDNMKWKERLQFAALKNAHLKSSRAWALKQSAMELFDYVSQVWARKHFRWWYNWASHSRLAPMIKVASMLKRRLENILTYLRHRITNAASESINAKIQWVKYTARGFRNKENFKNAVYFHCGKLDMSPSPTK